MDRETNAEGAAPTPFTVFHFAEARPHRPSGPPAGLTEVSAEGLRKLSEIRMGDGAESRVLFEAPGFSLMYVWFKSGFPLHRYSHGPDCLYQVIGGSLRMGEQTLRKRDGFFVPAGSPYAFTPGPDGVELLELRHEPIRDTTVYANNPAFWERAMATVLARRNAWADEPRPGA
jgi:hypothetical protein